MESELVPTNQAKLILPSLSSYINEKGDDLISHPPHVYDIDQLEFPLDLFDDVCLDHITDLDVVVALDVETAVHS